ncbi:inovirus-type Gp2 protein [Halorhodospira sp. 9622]|uniref:YagK/YfjJ domain-containing protein n=1 Tax=Halorhodospira sp. 9622 TaxID=2899136 RepID=UPI00351D7470
MKHQPRYHRNNRNWRLFYEPFYKGQPVLCDHHHHGPLVENFLEQTQTLLQRTRDQNAKSLALRFDLYLPNEAPGLTGIDQGSAILKNFWHNLALEFRNAQLSHPPKPEYAWARESGPTAGRTHFHVLLILDANSIRALGTPAPSNDATFSDSTLAHRIIRSWLSALGMPSTAQLGHLVNFQKNEHTRTFCAHFIHREDDHAWQHLFYLASYLCKANSKPVGQGLRTFETSRVYQRAAL